MSDILPIVEPPAVTGLEPPVPPAGEALGQDTFLRLLTEQLQNQDPLDPMANEDFVAQLAQFSSLEQLFALGSTMEAVYLGIASMNNATMAGLVGTEVVAMGDGIAYPGEGPVELHFDASAPVSSGTVTITDELGTVVATLPVGPQAEGEFTLVWDGTDLEGQPVESGTYSFSITATTDDGTAVDVQTLVVGVVDEMDYSTGVPQPSVGGVPVGIDDILRVTSSGA